MRYLAFFAAFALVGCKVVHVDEQAVAAPATRTVAARTTSTPPPSVSEESTSTGRAQTIATPNLTNSKMVGNWTTVGGAGVDQISVIFSSDGRFSMTAKGNAASGRYTLGQGSATAAYEYAERSPEGAVQQGSATFTMTPDGTSLTVTSADPIVGTTTLKRTSS